MAQEDANVASGKAAIASVIGPFRRRGLGVLALVMLDTALASVGVGMVFPVFQVLINPGHDSPVLYQLIPALERLAPDLRLLLMAGATIVVFGLKAAIALLTTMSINAFLQALRFHWVARIGEYYLYGSQRRVAGKKSGELLNNWFNETLSATRFFQSYIAFLSSGALVAALLVVGLVVDWRVTLGITFAGGLIGLVARRRLFAGSARLSQTKVALNQAVTASMLEDLTHARDLKLLQAEAPRLQALDQTGKALARAVLKGAVFAEIPRVAGEFLAVMALMVFVVICVLVLNKPPAQMLPLLAFFFVAFYRLIGAASAAASSRVKALNELHSVTVVSGLLAKASEREDDGRGRPMDSLPGDIRLRGVQYSYDKEHAVLSAVTATFPNGRTTLLVGPSGSGKSTLLDLLMRLESPDVGDIEVGGRTAQEYRLADWRRQFGYVSQEAVLFNGSVRMNLRLADPAASDEQLELACRLAGADAFIRTLPSGYDTLVGDRGHSLSGGQRKRIAIARALIRKPTVLILDEATTSFEQSLERSMLQTIRDAMPGLTIVQVTHRLTAQDHVDWVIALRAGRVVSEGSWADVQPHLSPMFESIAP